MKRLWVWFRRHREEERGAVLVLTAISMFAILAAGSMGVDLGFTVYGSRQAQAIADTAAADVIQYIMTADQQGSAQAVQEYLNTSLAGVLADNGSDAQLTVTPLLYQNGTYTFPTNNCVTTNPPTGNRALQRSRNRRETDGSTAVLGWIQYPGRAQRKWPAGR